MNLALVDNFFLGGAEEHPSRARLGPHLGLLSLVAMAEGEGHRATVVDPSLLMFRGDVDPGPGVYREMARAILDLDPDIVGFTSLGCNFVSAVRMAGEVRALRADVPILMGGPHPSLLHRAVLEHFPQVDAVVRHEAEATLPPLLAAFEAGRSPRDVQGVSWRDGGTIVENPSAPPIADLDTLPMPAWHAWPLAEHLPAFLRVEIGRGCPFACAFCSTSTFFDRHFRLKSAARIVAELDQLHADHGIAHFDLVHDMLTADRKAVLAFCDAVADRGYSWNCSARVDRVDRDLLARMRAAGCHEVYYGIETGSQRLQKVLNKRLDLGLVPRVVDHTVQLGMHAVVSFITGFPQEDDSDQRATLDLMGDVIERAPANLSLVLLHNLVPLAGTPLLAEFGNSLAYDGAITDRLARPQDDDDIALAQSLPAIFVDYHSFEGRLPRRRQLAVTALFAALRQLGGAVLAHVLAADGQGLASLVDRADGFAQDTGWTDPLGLAFLRRFFERTYGPDHYIVSFVRFHEAAMRMRDVQPPPPPMAEGGLALGTRAAILDDLHPVPHIQRLIEARQHPIPDGVTSDRAPWLVTVADPEAPAIGASRLAPAQASLLRLVATGTTLPDLVRAGEGLGHRPSGVERFVDRLVQLGVVVRSPSTGLG